VQSLRFVWQISYSGCNGISRSENGKGDEKVAKIL
jgi:hypothetical protein